MRLSVIIPVYNVESYIDKTLASVFDTTASSDEFEVIIVNDGTKDRSMDVVRRFADRPNLTILEQENQGLSSARMKGASVATGEYLWFMDSDDYIDEDGVGKTLKLLEEREGADVLMFPIRWVFPDRKKDWMDYQLKKEIVVCGKSLIRDLKLPVWAAPRFVYRRSLMENPWLFFPKGLLHEDEYFGPVLMSLANQVHVMPEPVYDYVQRSGSIISSRSIRSAYDMVSIHRLLTRFLEEALDPNDRGWFRQYCFGRLNSVYLHRLDWYQKADFQRFVRRHGGYAYRQWAAAFPDRSLKNKMGRFFYFRFPDIHGLLSRR